MSELPVWWNIAQACVWAATREQDFVDRVWTRDSRFSTSSTISSRSLIEASIDVCMEQVARGGKSTPTVSDAQSLIAAACAAGTLSMFGRKCGGGDLEKIPQETWAILQIRDHDRFGVIAASPDMSDNRASWWDELRVLRDEVQKLWRSVQIEDARMDETLKEVLRESDSSPNSTCGGPSPPPPEFVVWASSEHAQGRLITEMKAKTAMTHALGVEPGRNKLRLWLKTLDADWKAVRGTPPPRRQ